MATPTISVATQTSRSRLVAIGWTLTARSAVWLIAIFVFALFAGEVDRLIPGSDALAALGVCVAIGLVTIGARVPFDVVINRQMRAIYDTDAVESAGVRTMFGVLAAAGALVLWIMLRAVGTLLALPLIVAALRLALERPLASLFARNLPTLEDPALARRLTRFAREMGLGEPRIVVSRNDKVRSTDRASSEIAVFGGVIDVPAVVLEARPDVLETRLAEAIVQLRRSRYVRRLVSGAMQLVITAAIVLLFERPLLRLVGATDVTAPAFIPITLLILCSTAFMTLPVKATFIRWLARREIADVLDLTRAPDAMLAMIEDDAETIDQATPLRRFVSLRPSARTVRAEIDRWRQRRRVTLLFTDVANSTEHLNELGDDRWYHVVSDHDHVVRSVIEEFDGDEIDSAGDGFFVVFEDGGLADLAAIEMQRRLRDVEVAPGTPIGVRMGVHVGETIRRGREVVGREVNLAARIGASAQPGEILVSQQLVGDLAESARFRFGDARTASFKGFSEDHVVHPVRWWRDDPSGG